MKTSHIPTAVRLRRLALPLLAGLLLVLVASGQGQAANVQVHYPLPQARALHPQRPTDHRINYPVLGGAVATNASYVAVYAGDLAETPSRAVWTGSQWSGWGEVLGIRPWPNPLTVTQNDDGQWVFLTGPTHDLIWYGPAGYGEGALPGFPVVSAPAAVSWGGSRLDVIAWGTPFNIPVLRHDASNDNGATWAWDGLPYLMQADPTLQPTIVSRGVNSLDIFALGTDHALYYLSWNGSSWGQWQSLGGYLLYGHVAALPMSASQLEVYGIGSDGGLYRQVFYADGGRCHCGAWSGWEYVGGSLIHSAPTVVAWSGGNRTVCLLGGDNALWCADGFGTPTTWGWYSLGGVFVPSETETFYGDDAWQTVSAFLPPISVAADQNTVLVFAVDAAGVVWTNRAETFNPRGSLILAWGAWQSLGMPIQL